MAILAKIYSHNFQRIAHFAENLAVKNPVWLNNNNVLSGFVRNGETSYFLITFKVLCNQSSLVRS